MVTEHHAGSMTVHRQLCDLTTISRPGLKRADSFTGIFIRSSACNKSCCRNQLPTALRWVTAMVFQRVLDTPVT